MRGNVRQTLQDKMLDLQTKIHELERNITTQINETKVEALTSAERRRNEALGFFAAFLLILSILAYFGLQTIVSGQIHKLGEEAILARALQAARRTEEIKLEATKTLYELKDINSSHQTNRDQLAEFQNRLNALTASSLKDVKLTDRYGNVVSTAQTKISGWDCLVLTSSFVQVDKAHYLCFQH